MFKNRFSLIATALLVLIASLAVSQPFSDSAKSHVVIPVTGSQELSDYYHRHAGRSAPAGSTADKSDYLARHPELRGGIETSVHPAAQNSIIDECFDVSVSELAACREAGQAASQ